jgi:hypothetical protein
MNLYESLSHSVSVFESAMKEHLMQASRPLSTSLALRKDSLVLELEVARKSSLLVSNLAAHALHFCTRAVDSSSVYSSFDGGVTLSTVC